MASKKVLVDSSLLYAFIDRSDRNHTQAVKLMEHFSTQGVYLFTSYYSLQEVYGAVNKQIGISIGIDFLESILGSNIEILFPQKSDLISAFKLLKTNRNHQLLFKEAMTATLMQKKGISQISTFTYWHNLLGTKVYLFGF